MTKLLKSGRSFLSEGGFTLIEIMVTLAIAIVLTSWVVLAFTRLQERERLASAVEAIRSHLVFAQGEAAKRSEDVMVRFTQGANWGADVGPPDALCAPDAAPCGLMYEGDERRNFPISGAAYAGVVTAATTTSPLTFTFEPVRGTVRPARNLTVSTANYDVRIDVDAVGNIRVCSPAAKTLGRYPTCP